jgi:hypothetical protein
MSSLDTEEQSKYPPERLRGLAPYKRGQSGNPGGIRKGTAFISEAYKRLMALPPAQRKQYQPANGAEEAALALIKKAVDGEVSAAKEITDRTEGKAIQRRIDVTADEVVSKARLLYGMGLRLREQIIEHCKAIACDEGCAERMLALIPPDDAGVLEAVLATIDEQYHEAVIRELEAMQ